MCFHSFHRAPSRTDAHETETRDRGVAPACTLHSCTDSNCARMRPSSLLALRATRSRGALSSAPSPCNPVPTISSVECKEAHLKQETYRLHIAPRRPVLDVLPDMGHARTISDSLREMRTRPAQVRSVRKRACHGPPLGMPDTDPGKKPEPSSASPWHTKLRPGRRARPKHPEASRSQWARVMADTESCAKPMPATKRLGSVS